jgi:catechol 2,3-dioxygenase-like lactoylglutathione lyase family enzyme
MNVTGIAFIGNPVTDVTRTRKFYEKTLGLKLLFAHEIMESPSCRFSASRIRMETTSPCTSSIPVNPEAYRPCPF